MFTTRTIINFHRFIIFEENPMLINKLRYNMEGCNPQRHYGYHTTPNEHGNQIPSDLMSMNQEKLDWQPFQRQFYKNEAREGPPDGSTQQESIPMKELIKCFLFQEKKGEKSNMQPMFVKLNKRRSRNLKWLLLKKKKRK